jgi:hypothetical protein
MSAVNLNIRNEAALACVCPESRSTAESLFGRGRCCSKPDTGTCQRYRNWSSQPLKAIGLPAQPLWSPGCIPPQRRNCFMRGAA